MGRLWVNDANGNIETVERFDEAGQQYDDFAYQYHNPGGLLAQNRLYDLYDAATHTTGADIVAPADTFDNSSTGVNQNNNYSYDELGNLIADTREEIGSIHWTVAGKVKRIARTPGSTKPELVFAYGADGQRISKTVGDPLNGGFREYYIRDAQGNIMATYKYTNSGSAGASLMLTERPIYGSSRIGSHTQEMEMVGSTPPQYYPYTQPMPAPKKRYELTDHLGNVNTVVTGKLLPMAGGGYQADVVSAQGYEAFGSLLPGRNYNSGSYARGFNGQLKDDEIFGATGTSYTAEFWQYDPRVGRRWNIDPVDQVSISNYAVFGLNPILFNDPNGDCAKCPKNANQGDTYSTGFDAGGATPNGQMLSGTNGNLFLGSEKASNMLWGNYGADGHNTDWRVLSFEFESGARYTWDDAKQWYADASGNEFDDSWAFDVTNMVGGAMGPAINMAVNGVREGDPFKDIKAAVDAHGGSLSSFVWAGMKQTASDLFAGGHRGTQAWGSLGVGMLPSAPFLGGGSSLLRYGAGTVPKSSLGMRRLGGASAGINPLTLDAMSMFPSTIQGSSVRAGFFVQLNHNASRFASGRGWSTLYSNSQATIMGRMWQNQTIGAGLGISGAGTGLWLGGTGGSPVFGGLRLH